MMEQLQMVVQIERKVAELVSLIESAQLDLSSEKALQSEMEGLLRDAGWSFSREHRLSPKDIPDFLIEGGIVIECKMKNKSGKMDIYRQLSRYAQHDEVVAILLASNVAMGLPTAIEGKRFFQASLSRAWL